MSISGSRIRSFLVLLWTVFTAVVMLSYALFVLFVPEYKSRLGLGLIGFEGTTATVVSILVGIWGLSAAALLRRESRLGARVLMLYSFCGFVTTGGGLVLDLLFRFHYEIHWADYVMQTVAVFAFLLMALWCRKRAFPRGASELSILQD